MSPSPLEARLAGLLEKRRRQSTLRSLKSSAPGSVDFSSNDFLSLATNTAFQDDFLAALNQRRTPLGSTGSRLLDGNSSDAEELERDIASFHGADSGLLTNSGFDANVSIFAYLPQKADVVVYDELIHASVHDGMRQSRAQEQIAFKHNDVADLGRILTQIAAQDPSRIVFVAVEAVYSMDGDLAPLTEIAHLVSETFPRGNAHIVVDEAHATGLYGPNGSGRVCELGLEKQVLIRLHTFGKALACNGAIILCSPTIRLYLINYARPLIYTTFMSYPNLVAIKTAYAWLRQGKANVLATNLYRLINHLHARLQSLHAEIATSPTRHSPPLLTLPAACPESPIFALLSPQPRPLAAFCQAAGFVVRPVVAPTVPKGTERLRVCLHAGNTTAQIDDFVARVRQWLLHETASAEHAGLPGLAQAPSRAKSQPFGPERVLLAKI